MSDDREEFVERRSAPQEPAGWHLKKEVNLSIIISVIGIAIACVTAYTDLKKDIELIKADTLVLHQRDTQQGQDLREAMALVREQYREISDRLQRLIERRIQ
jgi:hypothetical protein